LQIHDFIQSKYYYVMCQGLYLFFKQVEMFVLNEINLKNMNAQYSTNEEFLLKSNFWKNFILIFNMVMLSQKLIFINQILLYNTVIFITFPLSFIIGRYIYKMLILYKTYSNLKAFIEKRETMY